MDATIVVPVLLVLALIVLDLAALRFGADSRHRHGHDWW
jgi:hypothetical protein